MRVLVLSDSHGQTDRLQEIVNKESPDCIIHLGDNVRDAVWLCGQVDIPVEYVRGNCDGGGAEEEKLLNLAGKKFFITHGHRYAVKSGPHILGSMMSNMGAHAALYGHTHIPDYEFFGRGFVLCPGAVCGNRTNGKPGYALLEWQGAGEIIMRMMEL